MKSSAYNYYLPYDGGVIFMNGLSEASFFVATNDKAEIYRTLIENPNTYADVFPDFIKRLRNQFFILDDAVDEQVLIQQKYESLCCPHDYQIMILPTYACNLRCWYCVQDHANVWLDDSYFESIKELIRQKISNEEIENLRISWFGGEPLTAYNKVLSFTSEMRTLAESMGKNFYSSITTNATLLNKERIIALREAGVTFYQITIDGDKSTHDKIKTISGKSAFEITMCNLALIARHTPCVLRYNYSPSSLSPETIIRDITTYLPMEVRDKTTLNLQPVWQEKSAPDTLNKVVHLMDLAKRNGISSSHKTTGLCYVDFKHYDCIYPGGHVGKCENDVKDMRHGRLLPNGEIDFSSADKLHYLHRIVFENEDCKACKYLPMCWGPCSQQRYLHLKHFGKTTCRWNDKDAEMAVCLRNKYLTDNHTL